MSSFTVQKETIDAIVTYVFRSRDRDFILSRFGPHSETTFGQMLCDLNADAIEARYRERDGIGEYKYAFKDCRPIQIFKSVQCLMYQCSEGDVPNRKEFKALQMLRQMIADKIIGELPEYESATWG